jgi:hypothetical protein
MTLAAGVAPEDKITEAWTVGTVPVTDLTMARIGGVGNRSVDMEVKTGAPTSVSTVRCRGHVERSGMLRPGRIGVMNNFFFHQSGRECAWRRSAAAYV